MASYVTPKATSSATNGLSSSRSAVGIFRYKASGAPSSFSKAFPWRLFKRNNGKISAPPSPYLVKKAVTFSAAWSVPITAPAFSPATA